MMPPDDPAQAAAEAALARRKAAATTVAPAAPGVVDPAEEAARQALVRRQGPASTVATAAPEESWGDWAKRMGYQAGQGLMGSAASTLATPADVEANVAKWLGGNISGKRSWEFPRGYDPVTDFPKQAERLGYDPESGKQNDLMGEIARGVGETTATLPLSFMTGIGVPANLAYSYGPSVLGDIFHHYTGWNPMWASLPASLSATGVERLGREAWERFTAPRALTAAQQQVSDLRRQKLEFKYSEEPGDALRDAQKLHDSEHQAANADREDIAKSFGQSQTQDEGMAAMQDKARDWKEKEFPVELKKAEHNMYYNPDGSVAIPQDAHGNLQNLSDALKNSFYRAGDLESAARKLKSRMPEGLEDAIDEIAAKQGKPIGVAAETTLDDMKKLRSILGNALMDKTLVHGVNAGQMNEAYRALSSDMEAAINNAAGPAGVARFKQFNEEAKRLYGLAGGPVSDIISTTDKTAVDPITPHSLINHGMWEDGQILKQLRSEKTLGEGVDEVAASRLRMGEGPLLSPGDPEATYKKMHPEAQAGMFGYEKAGKIQDVIDRRAQADENLENTKAAIKEAQEAKKEQMARESLRAGEAKTEATARVAATKAQPLSRQDIFRLGREGLSAVGGFMATPHVLHRLAPHAVTANMTGPQMNLLSAGVGTAGYLGVKGIEEILHNPAALRNLLVSGIATAPHGVAPTQ